MKLKKPKNDKAWGSIGARLVKLNYGARFVSMRRQDKVVEATERNRKREGES